MGLSRLGVLVSVVAVVLLTAASVRRVGIWHAETALWEEATRVSPAKPRPWVNLGIQYQRAELEDRAETAYAEARHLAQNPARPDLERRTAIAMSDTNRASLLMQQGRSEDAWRVIAAAHARSPTFSPVSRMYRWIADSQGR